MADMSVLNEKFILPIDIDANGKVEKVLKTGKKYVDKDVQVVVNVPDASFNAVDAGEITAVVSTDDTTYTSVAETRYAVNIMANASAPEVSVDAVDVAGFAAATDEITINANTAEQDSKTIYIKEGTIGGTGSASVESAEGAKHIELAEGDGDFVFVAKATGSVGVTKAGWVDPENNAVVSTDADTTYSIKKVTLTNSQANADDFTEVTAPVLTEDGYLFLSEGYIKDTKISLATLVPDDANITSENADMVYNTVKAYDSDGKLIVGTMGDAALGAISADDASATVEVITVTAAEDGKSFKVSGSQDIAGTTHVAVATRGLAETSLEKSGVISGTADVDASLDVIELSATIAEGSDGAVKPEIKKLDSTAKSSEIATVAPTGVHYVSVKSDAIEKIAKVTPVVTSEGYGAADVNVAVEVDVNAGASASDTYYIGIENGDVVSVATNPEEATVSIEVTTSVEKSDEDIDTTGVLSVAPTGKPYITLAAASNAPTASVTGDVVTTVTEGYVESTKSNTKTISASFSTTAGESAQYIIVYTGEFI